MKTLSGAMALLLLTALLIVSTHCKRSNSVATNDQPIPQDVLTAIAAKGFSTVGVIKVPNGYLVENDIFFSAADLQRKDSVNEVIVAKTEQYYASTITLVATPIQRSIFVSIDNTLPAAYGASVDIAIARYNALGLRIIFQRVASGADISITYASPTNIGGNNVEARSGFPINGNPYPTIQVNSDLMGQFPDQNVLATIIAHEMGHCIGFRHTDWMNPAYSCFPLNPPVEASATWIHGTPSGPDASSWMLACNNFVDRPFTVNDRIAIHYLYGYPPTLCGSTAQAIINGVCQTGQRSIDGEQYDPLHRRCTIRYYYVWSDGTQSQDYTSMEAGNCP
jgi:hypothetical protein